MQAFETQVNCPVPSSLKQSCLTRLGLVMSLEAIGGDQKGVTPHSTVIHTRRCIAKKVSDKVSKTISWNTGTQVM